MSNKEYKQLRALFGERFMRVLFKDLNRTNG